MEIQPIVRRHLNGIFAVVTQSADANYTAGASETGEPADVPAESCTTDIDSLALARDKADMLAHPGCDGACPGWQG
jgi:hypothetical protein